jgi:hypothetical protein
MDLDNKIKSFFGNLVKKTGSEMIILLLLVVLAVFATIFVMWLARKLWSLSKS